MDIPVLGVLALLAVFTAPFWVKKLRAVAPESAVSVLGRTALSRNAVVAVVRVGDRRLLVGAGEHGVSVLTELSDAGEASADAADAPIDLRDLRTLEGPRDLDLSHLEARTDAATLHEILDDPSTTSPLEGPRIGLLDRLRVMTVRSTPVGRPFRVPTRR